MASCGNAVLVPTTPLPAPFSGCPGVALAITRPGNNSAITNPVSIYNIDTASGAATFVSGPIIDVVNPSANLQVNGLGLNTMDGYLYGLNSTGPTTLSLTPATAFYRIGANAVAIELGTLSGPAPIAPDNASAVNFAAGEVA